VVRGGEPSAQTASIPPSGNKPGMGYSVISTLRKTPEESDRF